MSRLHALTTSRRAFLLAAGAGIIATQLPRPALAQAAGGVLRYGLSAFPPSLSPWLSSGAAAATVKLLIMRGLLGYDANGQLIGELAESWKSVDTTTYEFKIRSNAVFSNGKPVRPEDVVWTFEQTRAPGSTAYLKTTLDQITSIEAVDGGIVRIKLKAPNASLPYILASPNAPILAEGSTNDAPIACGPFHISQQEKGVFIEVERNPNYYKSGEPKVDKIRLTAYADENLRMAALESGDVDIIEYVPWPAFSRFDGNARMKLSGTLGPFHVVLFNTTRKPFDNPKVRQAIGYAIKREDIVTAAFTGQGKALVSFPTPPGSPFETAAPENSWTYDPDKAKALLTEAGYPNGFNCTLLATSTYGMLQDTAVVVAAYLQAIGINAELKLPEWASRITAGNNGDYDIAIHGTVGDYNDPDSLYPLLHSSMKTFQNSFGFASKRIDDLLDQGRAELDPTKRAAIYKQLAQAYFEEVPQAPLVWRVQAFGLGSNVNGFQTLPGFLGVQTSATLLDQTGFA
jgi:peptide/nickel transport system substrate-binding protein